MWGMTNVEKYNNNGGTLLCFNGKHLKLDSSTKYENIKHLGNQEDKEIVKTTTVIFITL